MSYALPDERGHFGIYGGMFVAETLMEPLAELRRAYERYRTDPEFLRELEHDLKHFVGRPSPLYFAERWSERIGGARIYLKREDLNHTGAQVRRYWPNAWARPASSPRPVPASMAWHPPQWRRVLVLSALSTWAPKTSNVRRSMSIA